MTEEGINYCEHDGCENEANGRFLHYGFWVYACEEHAPDESHPDRQG